MISDNDMIKMVFGFKVKYLRQKAEFSYQQLADLTGLSTSYLHDIEKGRKYPKVDKINNLASALKVDYDFMVSKKASKKLQPVIDFLTSDFLKDFPLEWFGINPQELFELFSKTPDKVNAFINTILKITRNYQMESERIYLAALRSYQDMYDNYFEEIETAVKTFKTQNKLKKQVPYSTSYLENLLFRNYSIKTDRKVLNKYKALKGKRSYFSQAKKNLYINNNLSPAQENFLIGREIAFQYLKVEERPVLTRIGAINSFEKLLNNFKASYFSVALLMDEESLVHDIKTLMSKARWENSHFLNLLTKYDVTPEMLLQRMTNILPQHFDIRNLFFIRLASENDLKRYRMTKELHLAQAQSPYANELNEHYCRRWVSVNIIKKLGADFNRKDQHSPIADAQISSYYQTNNQYLCISIAKTDARNLNDPSSVTIGLLINEQTRKMIRFLSDPKLPIREVSTTCERCAIPNCEARVARPIALERSNQRILEQEAMKEIDQGS